MKCSREQGHWYTSGGGEFILSERELVLEYVKAKENVERLETELKEAKDKFEKCQNELVEDLQTRGATQTAKYDGAGRISLLKPLIGARSTDEEQLFDYLRKIGRDDLIKETVHHRTLSAFVKEMLDSGRDMPEFINYWFKPSTRLTK